MPPIFYYIDLESVKGGRLLEDKIVEAENAPSRAQRMLVANDIIFQTVRPYQQNNYFYEAERDLPTIASTGYAVIRTKQDPKFIYSLIHTQRILTSVMQRCTGSSYPAVTGTDLEDIPAWIPCLEEQQHIGTLLALIGKRIDAQTKLIETLKKYKRGVSRKVFSKIHSDDSCDIKYFSEVFELLQNNTFSRECLTAETTDVLDIHYGDILVKYGSIVDLDENGVPFIKPEIEIGKFKSSSYLKSGDVIFADTAEDYTVGKVIELTNVGERKVLSGLHTMPYRPQITFAPMYLGYYLNSDAFRAQILPLIQGTKVSSISKNEMKKTFIHIPDIEKQRKFVNILYTLDKRITNAESVLEALMKMKQGLLQNLFI